MNLHIEAKSERGKTVSKSANDFIELSLFDSNRNMICNIDIKNQYDAIRLFLVVDGAISPTPIYEQKHERIARR